MNTVEKFHLSAFRAALRHAPTACTVNGAAFTALRNRRRPAAPNSFEIDNRDNAAVRFTAVLADFVSPPPVGSMIVADGQRHRITAIDRLAPLIHFDCAAGAPA